MKFQIIISGSIGAICGLLFALAQEEQTEKECLKYAESLRPTITIRNR